MGSTSSALFTGASQFSTDLGNVIQRAVGFATLPVTQMKNELTLLQNQSKALYDSSNNTGIDVKFAALQSAIRDITDAMSGASFQTEVSNTSALEVTLDSDATEGIHSVDVVDPGVYASSMSTSGWTTVANDASGNPPTFQLVIGSNAGIKISPADGSAQSVVDAINAQSGGQVTASLSFTSTSEVKISLQATTLGTGAIDLKDSKGNSLQTQIAVGKKAQYVVDGAKNADGTAEVVTSTSRTVSIAPGVSVTLKAADNGNPVNITVSRSTSTLINALTNFTNAYNDAFDALNAQRGQSKGALVGDPLIFRLTQVLSGISTYSTSAPPGGVSNLQDLGLDLGTDGHLTFTQAKVYTKDILNSSGVATFFGSPSTLNGTGGSGFLKWATDSVNGLEDPTKGLVKNAEADFQKQIDAMTARIDAKQAQVDQLQQRLTAQMAAADAAIASMEQQYGYLTGMFSAMQTADQQYK